MASSDHQAQHNELVVVAPGPAPDEGTSIPLETATAPESLPGVGDDSLDMYPGAADDSLDMYPGATSLLPIEGVVRAATPMIVAEPVQAPAEPAIAPIAPSVVQAAPTTVPAESVAGSVSGSQGLLNPQTPQGASAPSDAASHSPFADLTSLSSQLHIPSSLPRLSDSSPHGHTLAVVSPDLLPQNLPLPRSPSPSPSLAPEPVPEPTPAPEIAPVPPVLHSEPPGEAFQPVEHDGLYSDSHAVQSVPDHGAGAGAGARPVGDGPVNAGANEVSPDRSDAALGDFGDDRDTLFEDTDSALGDMSYASSLTSVTDSIYDPVHEHGRTYHSYKPGKYALPNDEHEQDRLDTQHYMFNRTIDHRLHGTPLDRHRLNRVLDIATGTGIWAIEFADEFPQAEVIGSDLSAIQPRWCPPNCHFEIDDAEDDWVWPYQFSFIHGRALLTCFADPRAVIANAFNALEPGGWLEFHDCTFPFEFMDEKCNDIPFEEADQGTALWEWNRVILDASVVRGRPWNNVQHYRRWFEEVGLANVTQLSVRLAVGDWPGLTDKESELGRLHGPNMYAGIEGMSLRTMEAVGWSTERTNDLVARCRAEISAGKVRMFNRALCVYGQKLGGGEDAGGIA